MIKLFAASFGLILSAGVASACPSWLNNGSEATMGGAALSSGRQFSVVAGGDQQLQGCDGAFGQGSVQTDPDFTFSLEGVAGKRLVFETVSECDSVVVVNNASGQWFYDDDSNSDSALDARVVLGGQSDGYFDVWVGTHDGSYCDATLKVRAVQ